MEQTQDIENAVVTFTGQSSSAHRQLFREEVLLVEEQDDARALEDRIVADALEQKHSFAHPAR